MKNSKRFLSMALALVLCALMLFAGGCGKADVKPDEQQDEAKEPEVQIPVIMTSGANDSMDIQMKDVVEDFNKEYKGKYQIVVEWLAGSAEDYRTKIKMLNASDSMPALVALGAEPAFYDMMVKDNRLVDLAPYLAADPEWQSHVMSEAVEAFTNDDGEMYMAPPCGVPLAGIYYNKDLFKQAGVEKFPETWDEFWAACDKLKAAGIPALALHTSETAWCPMLLASSYLGTTAEGRSFFAESFPENYDIPEMKKVIEIMKKEFDYTTSDAVGGTYAMAANAFFSGKAAMLPNGPWMMSSLTDTEFAPEGFADKVGYAKFPGKIMVGSMEQGVWSVTSGHEQSVIDAAVEFLKYYARPKYALLRAISSGEFSSAVEIPAAEYDKFNAPMKDYSNSAASIEAVVPNYQQKWDPISQTDVFERELPNLVSGKTSVDEFIELMDKSAAQYREDIK